MEANDIKAMREALENSNGLLEELAAIGEWGESAREQIAENNAALAAPPKNCNMITTWEAALSAFREETGNSKPLELWLGCEIQAFAIWLFATAEKKGEGK